MIEAFISLYDFEIEWMHGLQYIVYTECKDDGSMNRLESTVYPQVRQRGLLSCEKAQHGLCHIRVLQSCIDG